MKRQRLEQLKQLKWSIPTLRAITYCTVLAVMLCVGLCVGVGCSNNGVVKPNGVIPDVPTHVSATANSSNNITVIWDAVTGATGYRVYRSTSASGTYTLMETTSSTSYTNTELPFGTTYYYRVSAYNSVGESEQSDYVNATTTTATTIIPDVPTNVSATANSSNSITVIWDAVMGATEYRVYRSINSSDTYTLVETISALDITSYTNMELLSGTTYYYRVSSYNSGGESELSDYVSATTTTTTTIIPGVPTNVSATADSSNSITVKWDTVMGATEYRVYRSISASGTYTLVETISALDITSYTNTELLSGTTYYYRVSAVNGSGESERTDAVGATTIPNVPTNVSATVNSSNNITVIWDAVTGATEYRVYRSISSFGIYAYIFTLAGTTSSASYMDSTDLLPGITYYYRVSAYNSGGESSQSLLYVSATIIPDVPANVSATANSSNSITVEWGAVMGATGYHVYNSASSSDTYTLVETISTSSAPGIISYTSTDLLPGTTYYYRVSAYNIGGEGAQSDSAVATTVFDAPTGVSATASPSNNSITVSFNVAAEATEYRVYRSSSVNGIYTLVGTTSSTSYINTGLPFGMTYYYRVSAVSGSKESEQSDVAGATTIPAVTTNVSATANNSSSITIKWDAVAGATEYRIYRNASFTGAYALVGTTSSTSYINTGLLPGTTYYYIVSARNSGGEGEISETVNVTTGVLPTAPTGVSAVANNSNSITVSFNAAAGVTGYYVYRSTSINGTYAFVGTTSSTSYTNTGLLPGTTYYYRVSSHNSDGESAQSSAVNATTIPAAPTNVAAAATSANSITVSFNAVMGATGYRVYRSSSANGTYALVGTISTTSYTNTGLLPGTTYYYRVSAYNSGGEGTQSSHVWANTWGLGSPFTYDGQTYNTVVMPDGKFWMAENLNYVNNSWPHNNSIASSLPARARGSWCYGNTASNCNTFGRLYTWEAAMEACPPDWRLPTRDDWGALAIAAGGTGTYGDGGSAGTALKSQSGWGGTDAFGFSALPGGSRWNDGHFSDVGYWGYWWTATEYGSGNAYYRGMNSGYAFVDEYWLNKSSGFSVRCLRD